MNFYTLRDMNCKDTVFKLLLFAITLKLQLYICEIQIEIFRRTIRKKEAPFL
jgi:hypothetical protein